MKLEAHYLIALGVLLVLRSQTALGWKFKNLIFRQLKSEFNADYMKYYTTKINDDGESINLTLFLKKEPTADLWLQMNILYKEPISKKYRMVLTYDFNMCNVLNSDLKRISVIQIWLNNFLKYSNMPRDCPWKERSFKIVFTSFPYEANSELGDVKIQIMNTTGETALDVVLNLTEDIDDVTLRYALVLEITEGNYTALANNSVNFCSFLKQRSVEPILRIIYEDLLKHGNFIKSCPIKKGTYSLREYRIDEEMLPSYVPETSFFVDMKLSKANGDSLFTGRLNGKIDKSKGFNNLKMFSLG